MGGPRGTDNSPAAHKRPQPLPEAPRRMYKLSRAVRKELERRFAPRPVRDDQAARYVEIHDIAQGFAVTLCLSCPDNRERGLALERLDELVAHAMGSIARGEK